MFLQQPKQQDNLFSPVIRRSPTTVSSMSSWHPINASPSEDMWELPASSSSVSDDRDDFHTSGLHQEFSIYIDNDDYSTNTMQEQDASMPMPPTVTVRMINHQNGNRRDSSSTMSVASSRSRNSGIGLSGQRCVLGDATNTLRRKNNSVNTRRIQRSNFNWFLHSTNFIVVNIHKHNASTLSLLILSAPI